VLQKLGTKRITCENIRNQHFSSTFNVLLLLFVVVVMKKEEIVYSTKNNLYMFNKSHEKRRDGNVGFS
jgi:hypothetical protein